MCWDRRREIIIDEAGVIEKFGVSPGSIPDWLAVVGDSADGFPGIPGWVAKFASSVLAQYKKLESILVCFSSTINKKPNSWGNVIHSYHQYAQDDRSRNPRC